VGWSAAAPEKGAAVGWSAAAPEKGAAVGWSAALPEKGAAAVDGSAAPERWGSPGAPKEVGAASTWVATAGAAAAAVTERRLD
jgi:hypothetical protein